MPKNLIMIIVFVALLLGGLYFLAAPKETSLTEGTASAPAEKGELIPIDSSMKKGKALFSVYGNRPDTPAIKIQDEQGNSLTLADLKGQSLLVNFWATWCVPCREEMPELEALQKERGNQDFKVIIVSVDRGGLDASRKFLDDIGVEQLTLYYDEKGILARKMKAIGYPSTILINKAGQQFGLLTGPAHWNSPSAHALIDRLIAD
ncbi:TlpA family protein disulfide reductase [Paremcibacter congregatus]|uniref:Redoxin n=1 Tax=Paremcibacter congregatus TaxID=2043170 RepID=A0A2G4YPZ6_9PROT|nr:TlpA family protein disulfide reductase [Paremcibacter congregatus]PHZ84375.1 redoxin [Paremcibacter congregatus]QDE28594.1 TlpA family protein disulfide reductase [Paremcibacter congregatus]